MATPNYLWKIKDKGNVVLSPDNLPTLTTGTTNGTISWNGTNIAVKGLQGAAYVTADTFVSSTGNFLSTGYNRYCKITKSNTNVFPYNKVAHIAGTGSWYDGTVLFYVTGDWNSGGFGLLRISIRSNDQTATTSNYAYISCEARWLVRSGLDAGQVIIGYNNTKGAWNADLYFKTNNAYECYNFHQIEAGGRGNVVPYKWTLLNTSESYGSTTSSTDNVNCYVSIAAGGTYTNTITGVDNGLVATSNNSYNLNGYEANTYGTWGSIPVIKSADGVMEIGRYIDFHTTNTGSSSGRDYDGRIQGQQGGGQLLIPQQDGTIAVTTDITNAIATLDGSITGTPSASKTLSVFSETDGKVSATFTDIKIAESQVTNLTDDLAAKALKTTKVNGHALSGDVTVTASDVGVSATTSSVTVGSTTFNKYTHPAGSAASKSSGLYKFSTDSTSHISAVTAVQKTDITALGIPGSNNNQTVKVGTTTFGVDDAVAIAGGTNISVAADTTNKKITISNTYSYSNPWYLITTAGQESVSDGSSKLNVVTRDTAQTITGDKTFSSLMTTGPLLFMNSAGTKQAKVGYNDEVDYLYTETDFQFGDIYPIEDKKYSLGNSTHGWSTIYLAANSKIYYDGGSDSITTADLIALPSKISEESTARSNADATLQTNIDKKQDKLTAGDNVTISGSTISVDLSAYAKTTALNSYVLTTDSRLSDSRKASDVYDWAKKSTLSGAINTLSTGNSTPVDADYFISQYVNGGTTTTTYHRRPVSCLWNYIKSKLATVATSGSYTDLTNKPTIPTVNNGTLTMQVEGTTKATFSANQSGAATFNITSSDLGLSQALKFIGKFDSLPTASDYAVGNVVLVGSKEYVLIETSGTKTWDEMGDESSHALNTITITGTGALGGGGNLQSNRTITHNTVTRTNNTSTGAPGFGGTFTAIDSVTSDSYGHITAVNTKTITVPSAVATTSAAGLMSATDKTNLNNKVSKSGDTLTCGATFAFANSGSWQASGDSNVGVTFPYSCGGFTWSDQSDGISLYGEATGNDNLDLVIKFTDDNSNKLSIRNASGTQVGYLHANGSMGFNSIYEGGTALSSKYSPLAGSSSLTTCSKGTFGTAATYSTTTAVTSGSSALVTSDAVYQAIYGAMNTAV